MKYLFNTFRWNKMQMVAVRLLCLASLGALAGCVSLPNDGPSMSTIESGANNKNQPPNYVLVPVNQRVVDTMRLRGAQAAVSRLSSLQVPVAGLRDGSTTVQGQFPAAAAAKISAGDVLVVSIFASGGGLFGAGEGAASETGTTTGNSETRLPPQLVDSTGEITVPLAGRVPVVGLTPYEVENEITKGLSGKIFNPSVIVALQEQRGNDLVTVTGDVKIPTRVSVPMSGLRIVDAITAAGGSSARDYETTVTILRGQDARTASYSDILAVPSKNIALQVGDTVLVQTKPWSYISLGATGQTLHPFPAEELTAEDALASVGGLNDDKADPEAVFIYRFESPSTLRALGVAQAPITAAGVPVIYQLNLKDPGGFFMARQFAIRDKDVIFIGNASSIGIIKALNIVGALTSPAIGGLSATAGAATIAH